MNKTKTELMKPEGKTRAKRKGTTNITTTTKKASMLQGVLNACVNVAQSIQKVIRHVMSSQKNILIG